MDKSQLEQIDSVMNDIYLLAGTLGTTAGKVKSLPWGDHNADNKQNAINEFLNAINDVKRAATRIRALRQDATFANGITADAGNEGLQKIAERFDKATTDRFDRAMLKEVAKGNKR